MSMVAPEGPVYQAGTLSGNPLAMRAGIETLDLLDEEGEYERLERTSAMLAAGLEERARTAGLEVTLNRVGSMFTVFFTAGPVVDSDTAARSDTKRFAAFFHGMLERGVYLPPSQFESWFVSTAHGVGDVEKTLAASEKAFREAAAA
jgi:glutamate-1-semialdehyde 2,1-aminomutase